jgi:plasmid stabilization system protein ParE
MTLVVLPQAADEFDDAVAYYEAQQAGLGRRFRDEVDRHIRWIVAHPDIPRLRVGGYRRVNLKIFRHYVAYVQIATTIWILAIAHGHQKPEYWIQRKENLSQPGSAAYPG